MAAIGSVFFALWLALITPIFSLIAISIAFLPAMTRYRIIAVWSRLVVAGAEKLCGVRYRVTGLEHIPPAPVIFLSRHESAWETIAFQHILPPQSFVLRKNLLHIPFFGWGLRQMSPIAIDRQAGAQAMRQLLRQGKERMAAGFHIVIFPEGTRLAPGQQGDYHPGGAMLAKKTGATVIPIALDSGHCWPRNSFFKRPGLITVRLGQPIDCAHLSVQDINAKVREHLTAPPPDDAADFSHPRSTV